MDLNLKEKIAVCYTCCGPTYRKSAYNKIKNYYFDNDNIYYCILTDDKEYFKDLNRKNLIVNELEDFREEFPKLKDKEFFLKSSDKNDYAQKFNSQGYLFPFSTYRFNVLQAIKLGIKNVSLLCTDTVIEFESNFFDNDFFERTEMYYNAISEWDSQVIGTNMIYPVKILEEKYGLITDKYIRVLDQAARMYIPKDLESLKTFFNIWNTIIETLYENNEILHFYGSYCINDEYILAPILNALKLNKRHCHCLQIPYEKSGKSFFRVRHNSIYERFWRVGGSGEIKENDNYEKFLEINNLPNYEQY